MTESNLLPCPFCGGRAQPPENFGAGPGHGRFIDCMACHANLFRYRPDPKDADTALVEAWNLRLTHPEAQGNKDLGEPPLTRLEGRYRELLERRLAEAENADPNIAPFGMSADEARTWHYGKAVAYQYALEMLPPPSPEMLEALKIARAVLLGIGDVHKLKSIEMALSYIDPAISKATSCSSERSEAAPTSPQPINGESELESASNGMGLR